MKIVQQREYAQAPEHVWEALTRADAIRQWWLDTDFEPTVGHRFEFRDTPQGSWDGRAVGEVLEADAPHRVVFTGRAAASTLSSSTCLSRPRAAARASRCVTPASAGPAAC